MTAPEQWQAQNDQFLANALEWLRLHLSWKILQSDEGQSQLDSSSPPVNQAQVELAAHQMAQAANFASPPAPILLSQSLGLSQFEQTILLLCAAMELDLQIPSLYACLPPYQPYPTFALALSIFDESCWDAITADRPLRYWQLITIHQPAAQPLITSPLQIDERIVNYLKGMNDLDDRLTPLLLPLDIFPPIPDLPPSQQQLANSIHEELIRTPRNRPLPIIQLLGTDKISQQLIAMQVANTMGYDLYRLPVGLLPTQVGDIESIARLWQRESLLLPLAVYLDAQSAELTAPNQGQFTALQRFLARSDGVAFLASSEPYHQLGRAEITVEVRKPTSSEQQAIWAKALGSESAQSPALLSAQFNLNALEIQQVADHALATASSTPVHSDLWQGCLTVSRPRLNQLAQPIDAKATWEELVLPVEELDLLHQLSNQVSYRHQVYEEWGFHHRMNRGLGITALFAGDSGTGKTMAAEVIANELQLDLYRIDLSAVVSKYIGETEKNLRRLFDAAEDGGTVLFFDEADALFGKRSEVKDSHDRYANIEINYLLQRMEAYRGLAILATNLKSSLDNAFLRRLRFVINFPFPKLQERQTIWQQVFPIATPTETLDYDCLASFNLTGGNIHNIAINVAFQAAEARTSVTMPLILNATRLELKKNNHPINELSFFNKDALEF